MKLSHHVFWAAGTAGCVELEQLCAGVHGRWIILGA